MAKDLLDRRQRIVAALVLAAVDMPQEFTAASKLWIAAAEVCPGITVADIPFGSGRRAMLKAARALLDELLAEPPAEKAAA